MHRYRDMRAMIGYGGRKKRGGGAMAFEMMWL
jgi:hypothetical protein